MNGRPVTYKEINQIMLMHSKGMLYKDIGDAVGRSYKSIEGIITRNRGVWTRNFNFPEVLHAKRFGAC